MSAFSAIQSNQEIFYVQNSSDEEQGSDSDNDNENLIIPEVSSAPPPSILRSNSQIKPPVFSKFQARLNENILLKGNIIYFGLNYGESLVLKGQYILTIYSGKLMINGVTYHRGTAKYNVYAPISHSLPELLCISSNENSGTLSPEVVDIFTEKFDTIVKLENNFTKLESIGNLCPLFKNMFHNNLHNQFPKLVDHDDDGDDDLDLNFQKYSFCPILCPVYDLNVMRPPANWLQLSKTFVSQNTSIPKRVLIIGYKNSGKSSLLKLLANSYLDSINYVADEPIGILDIDPGQSEFSVPNSVSYSTYNFPLIGSNLTGSHAGGSCWNEYFGFNNPMENPDWYLTLVAKLFQERYEDNDLVRQVPLLVNMPGWIKGYGVQLIYKIIKIIKPTDIVYLKSHNEMEYQSEDADDEEDDELLGLINESKQDFFQNINIIKSSGVFFHHTSLKYSSQELSIFRVLSYFHKIPNNNISSSSTSSRPNFNFNPLLWTSPLKISYLAKSQTPDTIISTISEFKGICGVTVFNDDELSQPLNSTEISTIFDCSIVGIYAVETNQYLNIYQSSSVNKSSVPETQLPVFIPFSKFQEEFGPRSNTIQFLGLGIIHSINYKTKTFNIYLPDLESIKSVNFSEYKIILGRGRTSVPIWELYPKSEDNNKKRSEKLFKHEKVPFISLNDKFGKGGKILKVRRNIIRRRQ
ncbi:polynucleotide 5'-hydroxyl-kinase [Saccharomycopsis crataegensis]|uniref:Polynucleotide 5'-hydroxyl-kinase GRC3 n=1 Tax=Saccharomycopsis crataegensis TaxID=43959 RepID=A0AAV5QRD5_9ASCO|nr:polynucleotide 5'-hydroxyl-kinase [Saccharomycopsis crataegensis]